MEIKIRKLYSMLYCCCCLVKSCLTFSQPHGPYPARLLCPGNFPGKNTGVDWDFWLQGILLTHRLSLHLLCLLHRQVDSLPPAPPGKLNRAAFALARNWTQASHTADENSTTELLQKPTVSTQAFVAYWLIRVWKNTLHISGFLTFSPRQELAP